MWILTYIPMLVLLKRPRLGIALCVALIAIGCASSAGVTYYFNYPAVISGREFDVYRLIAKSSDFVVMLSHSYHYLPNYFAGVLMGYYLISSPARDEEKSWRMHFFTYCSLGTALFYLLLPTHWSITMGYERNRTVELFYAAFFRLAMACQLIPTFYITHTGMGELIKS